MRFLHVANGTCTTSIIRAAGIPGLRSQWADVLYEGPVPGGLTDEELVAIRERFLVGPDANLDDEGDNSLRTWRAAIERHESYDEVILWFEHDLFDQLNLIQLLTWIRGRVPAAKTVSLVCIGSFPAAPRSRDWASSRLTNWRRSSRRAAPSATAKYMLAARAWNAFRAADPDDLDRLRRSDLQALPFLSAALRRFLEEYPWTRDGLSRSERRLLELADPEPIELIAAFPRMQEGEKAYFITDGSILSLVEACSRTTPALLTYEAAAFTAGHVLRGAVSITNAGRDVLAGRLDRIATCGLDRWFGGVHLQGNGPVWRWDDQSERIKKA